MVLALPERIGMECRRCLLTQKLKRGDFEYLCSDNLACCKWLNKYSVTMLFSHVEGMVTTSAVPRRHKGSASKIQVPYPDVIKMGGVDLIDQRAAAYHLDWKSTIRFYLSMFFDLMDVFYDASKWSYTARFWNHCFNLLNWKIHKLKQSATRCQKRFQKKVSVSVWAR